MDRKWGELNIESKILLSSLKVHPTKQPQASPSDPPRCKWYGALDGCFHHFWQCPAFQKAREKAWDSVPGARVLVQEEALPACQSQHCWGMRPGQRHILRQKLLSLQDTCREHQPVGPAMGELHLFTDGSCMLPTNPKPLHNRSFDGFVSFPRDSPLLGIVSPFLVKHPNVLNPKPSKKGQL